MNSQPLHRLLLVTALVFGQWLAIAHDYQHPAVDGAETCQVCLHGPSFHSSPAASTTLACAWLTSEAPPAKSPDTVLTRRYTHASIRAPPTLLV